MSININCPKCNKEITIDNYSIVNVTDNEELKEKVLNDNIFNFICPECHQENKLIYPLIYIDDNRKYKILFTAPDEQLETYLDVLEKDHNEEYITRIVHSSNELKEKIFIFDQELDDKVIETIKIFMLDSLNKSNPEKKIKILYFSIEDDKYFVEAFSEDSYIGKIAVPKDKYAIFNNIYHEHKHKDQDDGYHVDFKWAYDLYVGNLKEKKNYN